MNFTVTAFVSADLTGDKEAQEQVLHSYRRSDCDFIWSHKSLQQPTQNSVKDWRVKHKFCSHSGSENSRCVVIYSFVALLGGRGRNVKQRPSRPSLLPLRVSELLPSRCLKVSINITATTAQKREENLHLVMRFVCYFTPVRPLFWINTCKL